VLAVAVTVAGWANRELIRIKIASVYARVAPRPGAAGRPVRAAAAPLTGDAPWALSALPECLMQTSESNGSWEYVRGRLPSAAVPIRPPATLHYGDCSVTITGDEALVRRGSDRLRIPPSVQFYRAQDLLVMIRRTQQTVEMRVYEPAQRKE
jgi:hypothetical protein